jgi:hypothetical protein
MEDASSNNNENHEEPPTRYKVEFDREEYILFEKGDEPELLLENFETKTRNVRGMRKGWQKFLTFYFQNSFLSTLKSWHDFHHLMEQFFLIIQKSSYFNKKAEYVFFSFTENGERIIEFSEDKYFIDFTICDATLIKDKSSIDFDICVSYEPVPNSNVVIIKIKLTSHSDLSSQEFLNCTDKETFKNLPNKQNFSVIVEF